MVTHDLKTVPRYAYEHLRQMSQCLESLRSPMTPIGQVIEQLQIVVETPRGERTGKSGAVLSTLSDLALHTISSFSLEE